MPVVDSFELPNMGVIRSGEKVLKLADCPIIKPEDFVTSDKD